MVVDMATTTNGVYLPPSVSGEIWQKVQTASVVQQLTPQIELPGNGVAVDIITGDPVAEFVGETNLKPVSNAKVSSKLMYPHTIAVIETFSNKFKRNKGALYNALIARLPNALSVAFDRAVLFNEGAPVTNFDTLANVPTVNIAAAPYAGLLTALGSVIAADGDISGWALAPAAELMFLGQVDSTGRPLFIDSMTDQGSVTRLLARPGYKSKAVSRPGSSGVAPTIGFGGDWSKGAWGVSDAISIDINTKGSVTMPNGENINLWQRNMFAVRTEIEIGFRYQDDDAFVRLVGNTPA
jgi:HK97 family phage major capsid protein